jgi:two-component system sensor histidine kinase RpfC
MDDGAARLRFEVADTGIGIAPAARERIFERFTQADDTIIDRYGGTGLGLAITRQLVEMQGGTIGVDSEPGAGSTFWFEIDFPRARNGEAEAPAPAMEAVLLAAGDAALAAELTPLLAARAASIRHAESIAAAADGLRALRAEGVIRPVVLLDERLLRDAPAEALDRLQEGRCAERARIVLLSEAPEPLHPPASLPLVTTTICRRAVPQMLDAALRVAMLGVPSSEAEESGASRPSGRRLSVLVAEDNRTNQRVIAKILERAGHAVRVVDNGEQALEALLDDSFDIVLMDLNMPVMNGIEATKLFRFASVGRMRVPVLGLTADATPEARRRCEEAGMDGCATKPIEPARLLALIEEAVPDSGRQPMPAPQPGEGITELASHPRFRPAPNPAVELRALKDLEALGGADFVAGVVEEFIRDGAEVLEALTIAVEAADGQAFRDQAHALRSGAANIGAKGIYEMCLAWRQIDAAELARDGHAHLRRLSAEFERVRHTLLAYAAEAGGRPSSRGL